MMISLLKHPQKRPGLVILSGFLSLFSGLSFGQNCALETVPRQVYSANPVVTYLMMAMAPEKLVGWNFPPPNQAKGIFPAESFHKPVIGGWFGQGRTPNMEELVRAHPDLMLMSGATVRTEQQKVLNRLGIPVCLLKLDTLDDYPQDVRNLGQWLGNPQRGELLALDIEQRLKQLAHNRETIRKNGAFKQVYYAESSSGLATECRGSIHSEVIPLAGALNPHVCPQDFASNSRFGRVEINFEQLLKYNPDAIVTQEFEFYQQVYSQPKWQGLKAVQNKQVFFMPQVPFRWMDRPPSLMRVLGAQWLMQQLYPEQNFYDMAQQTQEYIALYFGVKLSDDQIQAILKGEIVHE